MKITAAGWLVVAAYFLFNLLIGLYYRRKGTGSTDDYFVSGRNVSWWLAGTSMVAATFAADTPLAVSGGGRRSSRTPNSSSCAIPASPQHFFVDSAPFTLAS